MDFSIRIMGSDSNKKGDLFGRLMGDLLLALGYENCRLNIHKSGREIDIEASHRTEARRVVAECKALDNLVGGDQINKFIGVLDAEKRRNRDIETIGYYISLSGFTETALEQEKDVGGQRVVVMDGKRVISELIKGNIIVSVEKALERAGRCAANQSDELIPEGTVELLAHNIGWIWLIFFSRDKEITHYALVHAGGESLAPRLVEEILKDDLIQGGKLKSLTYLAPVHKDIDIGTIALAKEKYFGYLSSECGHIQLEGLPTDQDIGTRRLKLESIYVPLFLKTPEKKKNVAKNSDRYSEDSNNRTSIGSVLSNYTRIAILAAPGGGKSTLIKRLATAYAFPEQKNLVNDDLPSASWLPFIIRCRQLGGMAKLPICEILHSIPYRAEIKHLTSAFCSLVDNSLQSGDALILVDGLDEISVEGDRLAFVFQLCTFLATYPKVKVIVTSRVAGFRIVAQTLAAYCKQYELADFNENDIEQLTVSWHKEVINDKDEVIEEAKKLALTISRTDRVKRLAKNPLLLTTLLLVKRWVGQLPTKRSVLYGKAIEVLLMTWNVEGYEPLDQDEVMPQLAYVAYSMTKQGIQTISVKRLRELLAESRKQMPEILGYTKLSITEFVQRVESRSSLLMLNGYVVEDGTLCPVYEFQHLTFQEYLTAVAIIEGFYPNRNDQDDLVSLLEQYFEEESWKEVIPLCAVLSGRKVAPLIAKIVEKCKEIKHEDELFRNRERYRILDLLLQCLVDEVQITPQLSEEALEVLARLNYYPHLNVERLYYSRFSETLYLVAMRAFLTSETNRSSLGYTLAFKALIDLKWNHDDEITSDLQNNIEKKLNENNKEQNILAILAIMRICFRADVGKKSFTSSEEQVLNNLSIDLLPFIHSNDLHLIFASTWALAWLGECKKIPENIVQGVLLRTVSIWINASSDDISYISSWLIISLPLVSRDIRHAFLKNNISRDQIEKLKKGGKGRAEEGAKLLVAYYLAPIWPQREILIQIKQYINDIDRFGDKDSSLQQVLKITRNMELKTKSETKKRGK